MYHCYTKQLSSTSKDWIFKHPLELGAQETALDVVPFQRTQSQMISWCTKRYLCRWAWHPRPDIDRRSDCWRSGWVPEWPWRCWWSRCRRPSRRRCGSVVGLGVIVSKSAPRPARCGRCRSLPGYLYHRWRCRCRRRGRRKSCYATQTESFVIIWGKIVAILSKNCKLLNKRTWS